MLLEHGLNEVIFHPRIGAPGAGRLSSREQSSQGHFGVGAGGWGWEALSDNNNEGLTLGVRRKVCADHTFKEPSAIKA